MRTCDSVLCFDLSVGTRQPVIGVCLYQGFRGKSSDHEHSLAPNPICRRVLVVSVHL